MTADLMPAHLTTAAGVWYDEFSNLLEDIPLVAPDDGTLALTGHARATRWADALTPTDAAVLARYDHPHFGQWAAITTRQIGDGRITYVGTVPNVDLAKALMSWLDPSDHTEWRNLSETVTATGATTPDDRRVRFLHNWSWAPTDLRLPVGVADALTSHRHAAGENPSPRPMGRPGPGRRHIQPGTACRGGALMIHRLFNSGGTVRSAV